MGLLTDAAQLLNSWKVKIADDSSGGIVHSDLIDYYWQVNKIDAWEDKMSVYMLLRKPWIFVRDRNTAPFTHVHEFLKPPIFCT